MKAPSNNKNRKRCPECGSWMKRINYAIGGFPGHPHIHPGRWVYKCENCKYEEPCPPETQQYVFPEISEVRKSFTGIREKITKGDIVFYNDSHEAWATNLITEVLEDKGETVIIATKRVSLEVRKEELVKLPVDKNFRVYVTTRYIPKYPSPD
ncbi:MAG: hypothetical protein QMD50_03655 [Patescibacteria group bacterium]|nr:hypothetical protein [Patescibacteria group bacterium]